MKPFSLKITALEGIIFDENVYSLKLPGENGEFVVLPDHQTTVAVLSKGNIEIYQEDKQKCLSISEGIALITNAPEFEVSVAARQVSNIIESNPVRRSVER
jgi:F-type H+-transporting ATPase subunit epsilon